MRRALLGRLAGWLRHPLWRAPRLCLFGRCLRRAALGAALVLAAGVLALKLWLPELAARKAEIESVLSERAGRPVRIATMDTDWEGFSPLLRATGITVLSADGRHRALGLEGLHLKLSLLPLLRGRLVFHEITLQGPALWALRDTDGRIRVADFSRGEAGTGVDAKAILDWLWRQDRIHITGGRIRWVDRLKGEPPLLIRDIDIRLSVAEGAHRLAGSVRLPESLCRRMNLSARFEGAPGVDDDWRGWLALKVAGLRVQGLPAVIAERLPQGLRGTLDFDGRLRWARGVPVEGRGAMTLAGARARLPGLKGPLVLERVDGAFHWQRRDNGWRLAIDGARLAAGKREWRAGRLTLGREGGENWISADRLRVDALADFIAGLPGTGKAFEALRAMKPEGEIHAFRARVAGGRGVPLRYQVSGRLVGVSARPYQKLPGVRGLAGELAFDQRGGRFHLRVTDAQLELPRFLDAAVSVSLAEGRIAWQRQPEGWRVTGKGFRVANRDGRGQAEFTVLVPRDRSRSPQLDLTATLEAGDLSQARRYAPVRRLKARTVAWLDRAFVAGRIEQARVRYVGPVRKFPAPQAETFLVRGRVLGGVVDYARGWPRIEAPAAEVLIDRSALWVSAEQARVHGLAASQVSVHVNDLRDPDKVVAVRGRLAGPVAEAVAFLKSGPLFRNARQALAALRGEGSGELELSVDVVPRHAERARVQGRYVVKDGALAVGSAVRIEGINGRIEFDERGVRSAPLAVRVLNGPARLAVDTPRPGRYPEVRITGSGRVDVKELVGLLGPRLVEPLSGETGWSGTLRIRRGGTRLELSSDLAGVAAAAPPPLAKQPAQTRPFRLTAGLDTGRQKVEFEAGKGLRGLLSFRRRGTRLALERGEVVVGQGRPAWPREAGLGVRLGLPRLDLDRWVDYLQPRLPGPGEAGAFVVQRLAGEVGEVIYQGRPFHDLRFTARRQGPDHWRATLAGRELAGELDYLWSPAEKRVALDLDHLFLRREREVRGPPPRRGRLPAIKVRARAFRYGPMRLGRLLLEATPDPQGLSVRRFELARPHMRVSASGHWRLPPGPESSRFRLSFTASDVGRALKDLAVPQRVEGGRATIHADLAWNGGPGDFRLARVEGSLDLEARNGRFPELDPGAGRVFGLFNLDTLARRLRLDFSDVFRKGFVFDRITGHIALRGGNAYTGDLQLAGPTANIRVAGRSGIVTEDYDLELTVEPQVGGNLAVAGGVLGTPATGAALFLFQKLFKNQIAQLVRYRYQVTGPWQEPSLTRLEGGSQG